MVARVPITPENSVMTNLVALEQEVEALKQSQRQGGYNIQMSFNTSGSTYDFAKTVPANSSTVVDIVFTPIHGGALSTCSVAVYQDNMSTPVPNIRSAVQDNIELVFNPSSTATIWYLVVQNNDTSASHTYYGVVTILSTDTGSFTVS